MPNGFESRLIAAAAAVAIVGSGTGVAVQWESFESLQVWLFLTPMASFIWGAAVRRAWAPILPGAVLVPAFLLAPSEAMGLFALGSLMNVIATIAGMLTATSWSSSIAVRFGFIAAWSLGLLACGYLIESELGGRGSTPAPRVDAGGLGVLCLGTLGAAVIGFRTRNAGWALVPLVALILFPHGTTNVDLLDDIEGLLLLFCAAVASSVLVIAATFGWYRARRSSPLPIAVTRFASVAVAVALFGVAATGTVSAANHQHRACSLGIDGSSGEFGEPWQYAPDNNMTYRNRERGEACRNRYPLPKRWIIDGGFAS